MTNGQDKVKEAHYDQDYLDYLTQPSRLRKFVRQFYLGRVLSRVEGPSFDLGCGVGTLLRQLPAGSLGLEVNQAAVRHCRAEGLTVTAIDPTHPIDQVLKRQSTGKQTTLCCLHVIEHLANPVDFLNRILTVGEEIGLVDLIFVVPGHKGFASDATHIHFIDRTFFKDIVAQHENWQLTRMNYFPIPSQWFSKIFTHNELQVQITRASS